MENFFATFITSFIKAIQSSLIFYVHDFFSFHGGFAKCLIMFIRFETKIVGNMKFVYIIQKIF